MKNIFTRSAQFDPLNNYLFFKIFGEKGDEIQLLGFINAVLGRKEDERFTSVEILENTTFMAEIIGGKSCTLDVRAKLPNGAMVNVEVQLSDQHNMNRRSLFYLTREYSRRLKAGENYSELPDLIAINLVDYDFPATRNYHSCFHLREDTEQEVILTNSLEIHYINMVKYRKLVRKNHDRQDLNDPLYRWLVWFDRNSPPELIEEVVKMDEAIKTADDMIFSFAMTDDEMDYWFRRKLFQMDRENEIKYARAEGQAKGIEKGQQNVFNLLDQGFSIEEIKRRLTQTTS